MWYDQSVFYQIYPLGFCDAPFYNDRVVVPRIKHILNFIDHFEKMQINAIYFSPLFSSQSHGYDTIDYLKLDERLGENQDFKEVCDKLHEKNIKIVLDGVFNHVGRDFWAFKDVQEHRQNSRYKDWFYIQWENNSCYNDGFYYEGWEGHYELVQINLKNEEVIHYLFSCIQTWIQEFDIDGLRLDVAYLYPPSFIQQLRLKCDSLKKDFVLIGELLHGDYNQWVNEEMLHSCTNYECYKGLYSSFNDQNLFEIAYSLNRQFGSEPWTLYKGKHLLNFVDNHDVTRVASILKNEHHLPLIYGLLFGMPGVPCLYYGSEWGMKGIKQKDSDALLRPFVEKAQETELTSWIAQLAFLHQHHPALYKGSYRNVVVTNKQLIFERKTEEETIFVAINLSDESYCVTQSLGKNLMNLFDQTIIHELQAIVLAPYSCVYWKEEQEWK